ncbi:MAG: SDR family NAD(P)-dependent oxidoreductase [Acidobacteriia bacterium]|nr:SDR family NAD(P)-dependent oxidoreductase [Terriglobia bacterium]
MHRSAGKRIIITGGTSGIGAALVWEFAQRGAHVGTLARREPELQMLCQELRNRFPRQIFCCHPADVRKEDELEAAMDALTHQLGGLDIAIANSGIGERKSAFSSHHWEIARETLSVNVLGAIHTLEIAKNYFLNHHQAGQLVGMSSVAAVRGFPKSAAYCTSKAALAMYLEAIRGELAGGGIDVISVHPGFIRTPLTAQVRTMPWLMDAEPAARRIARAIEVRKKRYVFPAPMHVVYWFLKHLPDRLYDYGCTGRGGARRKIGLKTPGGGVK